MSLSQAEKTSHTSTGPIPLRLVKITFPRETYPTDPDTTAEMLAVAKQLSGFTGQQFSITDPYAKEAAIYFYRIRSKGEPADLSPPIMEFFERSPFCQTLREKGLSVEFVPAKS